MSRAEDADSDAESTVRAYYDALDGHEYGRLESLLVPGFVQQRPDRRFEGREAFVRFMREERPNADTEHELLEVFGDGNRVAARGRLLEANGGLLFEFADHFALEDGEIVRLETYTR